MLQGVVVDAVPVAMHEGTDKEEQRGLRLVEIGDEHFYYFVFVARNDDNLGTAVEDGQTATVHPVEQGLNTLNFEL